MEPTFYLTLHLGIHRLSSFALQQCWRRTKTIRNTPAPRTFLEDEDERLTKFEMRQGCLAKNLQWATWCESTQKQAHVPFGSAATSLDFFHMFPACPRVSLNLKQDSIIHWYCSKTAWTQWHMLFMTGSRLPSPNQILESSPRQTLDVLELENWSFSKRITRISPCVQWAQPPPCVMKDLPKWYSPPLTHARRLN